MWLFVVYYVVLRNRSYKLWVGHLFSPQSFCPGSETSLNLTKREIRSLMTVHAMPALVGKTLAYKDWIPMLFSVGCSNVPPRYFLSCCCDDD